MSEKEFYRSTMKYILSKVKAHSERREEEVKHIQYLSWLSGSYIRAAVWGKKYPPCPIKDELQEIADYGASRGLTEEEQNRANELIFARFAEMQAHHEQKKKREGQ